MAATPAWSSGSGPIRPTNGLGAIVGPQWCDAEAERTGVILPKIELMVETGRYNEVDRRSWYTGGGREMLVLSR